MKRQIMVVRKLDRIPLRQKSVIVSAFVMMAAALVAEAKPVTWWASHPAKPGEHVLVSGGGWTGNVKVRFEGRLMDPTSVSDTGVTFRWPEDMDVLRPSVALEDETGSSEPIVLNAPTVWWMQGDDFDAPASVRMWCPAREASLHLDGALALDAGTDEFPQLAGGDDRDDDKDALRKWIDSAVQAFVRGKGLAEIANQWKDDAE